MKYSLLALLLCWVLISGSAAQSPLPVAEPRGPYLGILFSPVPSVLVDHLPRLPRDTGVLVTHVLPDSPAARAGLRRHDVLVRFADEKIGGAEHLAQLIRKGKLGKEFSLTLIRSGEVSQIPVKLDLGPVLDIAPINRRESPPGVAKPGSPATLNITAEPLDNNQLRVTFEFPEQGRYRQVTCSGNVQQIDRQIQDLPPKVQTLARAAVLRLRQLELQKTPDRP